MYKIFNITEKEILSSKRWAGTFETVRKNLNETQFITQLKTGVPATDEDEPLLTKEEALDLVQTSGWKIGEVI